jgi:hypothetical protein
MRSLDRCTSCTLGTMKTYRVNTKGFYRTRYLKCTSCGNLGKEVIPIDNFGRPIYQTVVTYTGNDTSSLRQRDADNGS